MTRTNRHFSKRSYSCALFVNAFNDTKLCMYDNIFFWFCQLFFKKLLTNGKNNCIICINTVNTKGGDDMINLNPKDSRPIYEQICEKMRDLIIGGYLNENEKIPSVRELASSLAINPNTIQKAYKTLEAEGYIYSKAAKGYFVGITEQSEQRLPMLLKQLEECVGELNFLGYEKDELLKLIDEKYEKGSAKND